MSDYRDEYERACQTIAEMHAAAVGEITGPIRGVVEDVADLRAERDRLEAQLLELNNAICWDLTCLNCSALMDKLYAAEMCQTEDRCAAWHEGYSARMYAPCPHCGEENPSGTVQL